MEKHLHVILYKQAATAAVILGLASITGCGTSASLRQGHDIAEAGKAYSAAMVAVADITIDRKVDQSAVGLERGRAKAWKAMPASAQSQALDQERKDASSLVHTISIFKAHSARLGDYFQALGKLVAEPAKQGYADATNDLAKSVGVLGKTLESTNIVSNAHVTPLQQEGLGTLGGIAGEWYQSAAVRKVLERDGTLIETQLEVQRRALAAFAGIINAEDALSGQQFFVSRVREPFLKDFGKGPSATPLSEDWRTDFATSVKSSYVVAQVEDAKIAADKFAKAWNEFKSGKPTTEDVVGDLTRVRDGLQAAQKVHENRHETQ